MDKLFCPFCATALTRRLWDGYERQFCDHCRVPIYENPVPATAAVLSNSRGDVLLVKRAVDPGRGKWCLPGGFLEIGESPEQCVLRELREETGLDAEVERLVGIEMSQNVLYKSVLVAAYAVRCVGGTALPGDDAVELDYFHPARLPEIAFASHRRIIDRMFAASPLTQRFGAYVITSGDHLQMAGEACRAGARILQYRDKKSMPGQKLEVARRIRDITREHHTLFLVNDQIDLALLSGADGVHLGQDDIPLPEARRLVLPGFLIGVSTHSLQQAVQAEAAGADYIGIGPVFATPTKSTYPPIGLVVVGQVLAQAGIPVVAIGGIDLQNLEQLIKIGVQNVAMVRAYQRDPFAVVRRVNEALFGDGA